MIATFRAARSGTAHSGTSVTTRPEDERLPPRRLVTYGLQHILTMYGGIIAPPLIVGQAAGLSPSQLGLLVTATIFVSGLATLLQTLGVPMVGSRLPLVQGASFSAVSTMAAIATRHQGLGAVFGATIAAGVVGLVVSMFFGRIVRFFPPVVTGSVITVIGLSLLPTAFGWASGGSEGGGGGGSGGDIADIGLAGLTLLIILVLSRVNHGGISRMSILLGIVLGTAIAGPLGMADFSSVGAGPIVSAPAFLTFGVPQFHLAEIVSMVIVMLVTLTETTADILAVGEIVDTPVDSRRLSSGLRADMISTTLSPLLGGFTCSAFAQNVGLVALTKVKSRFAVATGGGILVLLGLLPVVGRVVSAIPLPVLGGAGIVLFGSVAASGIRTLANVSFGNSLNLVIVATAIGFGVIPIAAPDFWSAFPDWFALIMDSGISAASVVAILLNLVFNEIRWPGRARASVLAASSPKAVTAGSSLADAEESAPPVVEHAGQPTRTG